MASCKEDIKVTVDSKEAPVLSSFTPTEGKIGTEITIEGENLTDVSSVTIGGGEAALKYKIDNKKIVVKVTQESLSGKIKVKNEVGESESTDEFAITYATPELTKVPDLFSLGQEILLEGNNLEAVTKITFGTENVEGEITYQTENEIMVIVPTFNGTDSNIRLIYFDGTSEQAVTPENAPSVDRPKPVFNSFDITEKNEGEAIDFIGTNLNLVEKIIIGSHEYTKEDFTYQSGELITIILPEVEGDENGTITATDYENTITILSSSFTIKNIILYVHKNISMGPNKALNGESVGFNPITGDTYSICSLLNGNVINNVFFFTVWTNSQLRIVGAQDAANKIKSYECNGKAIGTLQFKNAVYLRVLENTNSKHQKYIDAVKNGTLTDIPDNILTEITKPGSNGVNYCNGVATSSSMYEEGSVIFFALAKETVADGPDAKNYTPLKVGFIHVKDISSDTFTDDNGETGVITFDSYFKSSSIITEQ